MTAALVGLDIGTTSVKAAGFDRHGRLLCAASAPIAMHAPAPSWAEQEPGDWWNAACRVLKAILENLGNRRVAGVGLSGQCPSHVLVTSRREAIGRAIIWRDQRAVKEAAWLRENLSAAQTQAWVGITFVADPTSPPARLLWLKEHRAKDWQQAAAVLQPKDFVALLLTGKTGTDWHSAYLLAHPKNGYQAEYFTVLEVPIEKMPPLLRPTDTLGEISPTAAEQTGLPAGTPVIAGTIDAYCDNLAGGILTPGQAVDVAGTSESVSLAVEEVIEAAGVFPASIDGGGAFLCGPTQAGGDTLRWLFNCFYTNGASGVDFAQMEASARAVVPGCTGLVFLPYLNGERAPLWDSQARGAFIGLSFEHDRRHCTRAVYESVGYAIRHILEIAEEAAGLKADHVVACGGGSRSAFWNQIKADILQRPLLTTAVTETGCLGAAILASVGTGIYPDLKEACGWMVTFNGEVSPNPALAEVYTDVYQAFRAYYPALRQVITTRSG